jgi:hypothetical protein
VREMKRKTNPKDFDIFLMYNGYDSKKLQYISKDCYDYRVLDIASGKEFYIRY